MIYVQGGSVGERIQFKLTFKFHLEFESLEYLIKD